MQSDLHGMVPVVDGHFMGLQQTALRWPNPLRQAAAVCNSLTLINRSDVVGDFSERRAFKAVEAHFMVSFPFLSHICAACQSPFQICLSVCLSSGTSACAHGYE